MILDEAQELPLAAMGALLPTLSARPNPQVIYTGTVPAPENDAEHWTSVRDRGRRGGDPGLAWLEWSPADPLEGHEFDLDDRAAWVASNPALGIRITEETVQRERNSLDAAQFARERLSIWSDLHHDAVIDPLVWAAAADTSSASVDPVAFAVDVAPDRSTASVGLGARRADGLLQVEVIANERGTGWVVEYLTERNLKWKPCAVVVDAAGPAASLIPDLEKAGVAVTLTSGREMGQACGAFYDAVVGAKLRHRDDPFLNVALGAARKRPLGDAWAWHRKDASVDITPLVAVTLALYGFQTTPPKKRPGLVAGF